MHTSAPFTKLRASAKAFEPASLTVAPQAEALKLQITEEQLILSNSFLRDLKTQLQQNQLPAVAPHGRESQGETRARAVNALIDDLLRTPDYQPLQALLPPDLAVAPQTMGLHQARGVADASRGAHPAALRIANEDHHTSSHYRPR